MIHWDLIVAEIQKRIEAGRITLESCPPEALQMYQGRLRGLREVLSIPKEIQAREADEAERAKLDAEREAYDRQWSGMGAR